MSFDQIFAIVVGVLVLAIVVVFLILANKEATAQVAKLASASNKLRTANASLAATTTSWKENNKRVNALAKKGR